MRKKGAARLVLGLSVLVAGVLVAAQTGRAGTIDPTQAFNLTVTFDNGATLTGPVTFDLTTLLLVGTPTLTATAPLSTTFSFIGPPGGLLGAAAWYGGNPSFSEANWDSASSF